MIRFNHIPFELSCLTLISVLFLEANCCNSEMVESDGKMILVNLLIDDTGVKNCIPVLSLIFLDFL